MNFTGYLINKLYETQLYYNWRRERDPENNDKKNRIFSNICE